MSGQRGKAKSAERLNPEPWAEYADGTLAIHYYKKGGNFIDEPGVCLGHCFSVESFAVAKAIVASINGPNFQKWCGRKVEYISGSGKKYRAEVDAIPTNPGHGGTELPTVSLSFRDENENLVRKFRVLPFEVANRKRQVWRPV